MKKKPVYLFIFVALSAAVVYSCSKSTTTSTGPIIVPPPVTPPPVNTGVPPYSGGTTPLPNTVAKLDTLNVMAYNVLNFGDLCQGSVATLEGYLKTIVQYVQPDLFSAEKMNAFDPTQPTPYNLAAEITNNALNAVFPNKFAYCTPTNTSADSKMSVLFYNKQKLTYVSTFNLYANVSDFDLYKLYYNDPNLAITHDTTYLYVVVNHTQSGSAPNAVRDAQESGEMAALRKRFAYFSNLIVMGDCNQHNTTEAGYQSIISAADTTTQMSDPPFYPDKVFTYPADWDNNPVPYGSYLTTSTRQLSNYPNSCGTNGGASSWYDHIFISPFLIKGSNYMGYIPGSYLTIGNDGHRFNADINATTPVVNTSAPANVLNALFQLSNKYPITIKILVKANRTGGSIPDPAERN
ncbi:hypothetical protein [uncultured Mucilaginibacter sp.]|uniref:hypothetical protein n=1 Tax=uncultured Mucilaginibacter sp. TaxID=797541 RepID=UPI0025D28558|nr:hypothetical protein [uncultured Mucilaginibacter sp.]